MYHFILTDSHTGQIEFKTLNNSNLEEFLRNLNKYNYKNNLTNLYLIQKNKILVKEQKEQSNYIGTYFKSLDNNKIKILNVEYS